MSAIAIFPDNGKVEFLKCRHGTLVNFFLKNFEPNSIHAIHIHEFGDTSDGCKSLGGHYNPTNQKHGFHAGDLIKNFQTDHKGSFSLSYIDPNFKIEDIYGRSVVIHKYPDDGGNNEIYKTFDDSLLTKLCNSRGYIGLHSKIERLHKLEKESLISGNAGKRLCCAIIARSSGI